MSQTAVAPRSSWTEPISMDADDRIRLPRAGAVTAALLRIGLGFLYFWAFLSQGFGIGYTNTDVPKDATTAPVTIDYGWHFSYDADNGWITSGFSHSPTEGYTRNLHGPTSFVKDLPVGMVDFVWMFAVGGLGIALLLGVCAGIAGWGGFILNICIWFAGFPPSSNPLLDGEHMAFALSILLLMWLHASNYWGLGRWWRAHTPSLLR